MIIQKIQQKASKLYIVLPLVALITFLSYESKANPTGIRYSSEEVFMGLFFAEGPVASQIPELEGVHISNFIKDADQLQHALDYQRSIFEEIQNSNPEVVTGLSVAIGTKDLVKIESAIASAGDAMLQAINTLNTDKQKAAIEQQIQDMEAEIGSDHDSKEELNQAVSKYLSSIFSNNGTDIQALILYLLVFFAIAVYAAAWFWTQGPRSMVSDHSNDIYKESLVLSVSKIEV
jgi:SdpC family antimicrobial peptide